MPDPLVPAEEITQVLGLLGEHAPLGFDLDEVGIVDAQAVQKPSDGGAHWKEFISFGRGE